MQAESSDLVRRSVEEGMGVAFVSSLAIQDSIERGKILKFEFENINTERQIYLMYHKDRIMTLPVTSVIKSIRQQCLKISGQYLNRIISYRNPAPPAGFTIIKNVQKRKKRVSVNRNTLFSSNNKCKKHSRIRCL